MVCRIRITTITTTPADGDFFSRLPSTDFPRTGKQWHDTKKAFRPNAGLTSYAKRAARDKEIAIVKAHEKEMKDEKEAERQVSSVQPRGIHRRV